MRFNEIFSFIPDIRLSIKHAFWPTLVAILKSPTLIFRPRVLSRLFFYHAWTAFGPGINTNTRQLRSNLITPSAKGIVLDIGAGVLVCIILLFLLWLHV